jgi:hypothetical protein
MSWQRFLICSSISPSRLEVSSPAGFRGPRSSGYNNYKIGTPGALNPHQGFLCSPVPLVRHG